MMLVIIIDVVIFSIANITKSII